MPAPIRVAVIGAGAFGRNHLRVLHDLSAAVSDSGSSEPPLMSRDSPSNPDLSNPDLSSRGLFTPRPHSAPVMLAAVVEANPVTRAAAVAQYAIPGFASIDELLAADLGLHAATVCVPTVAHAAVAGQLLEAGLDLLVEKPLTATLAEADRLLSAASRHGRILAAGHLERFNPAVNAALGRLTRPMFFEAHRLSIFTPRSLDVDVVLDLMIHDLDILLTMAASAVTEVRAVGLPVLSGNVDIANVRLEFASGAVANLTASRVSTEQVRKLRLFQPAQYLSLDYARQELLTINVDPRLIRNAEGTPSASMPPTDPQATDPDRRDDLQAAAAQSHPSPGLTFSKLDLPRAEPLRLELEDFLHAVRTRTPPRVTGAAARQALALALEINAAMASHAHRAGLA